MINKNRHPQVKEALDYAILMHGKQKYGKMPYSYHLEQVLAQIEILYPNNLNLQVAACLHDVIEDTSVDFKTLKEKYGYAVAQTVKTVSKPKYKDEIDKFLHEPDYILEIATYSFAAAVKMADVMVNLNNSYSDKTPDRLIKYVNFGKKLLQKIMKYLPECEHEIITLQIDIFKLAIKDADLAIYKML